MLSARVLRPDLYIVGRAETEDATVKLKRAGADRVISPYQIGAIQMAQSALRPAVVDFMALATSSDNVELAMEEITIAPGSAFATQSILDANLRQRFGVIVVGIQRQDQRMEFNPEPDTAIRAGDKLVVLGRPESLKRLEAGGARLMAARVLDGTAVAQQIREELKPRVDGLHRARPGGRRGSASCSSATTRRRRSTCAAS